MYLIFLLVCYFVDSDEFEGLSGVEDHASVVRIDLHHPPEAFFDRFVRHPAAGHLGVNFRLPPEEILQIKVVREVTSGHIESVLFMVASFAENLQILQRCAEPVRWIANVVGLEVVGQSAFFTPVPRQTLFLGRNPLPEGGFKKLSVREMSRHEKKLPRIRYHLQQES
jgi:hypothetical protein